MASDMKGTEMRIPGHSPQCPSWQFKRASRADPANRGREGVQWVDGVDRAHSDNADNANFAAKLGRISLLSKEGIDIAMRSI